MGAVRHGFDVTPSASRLLHSMRDIGYDFPTAIADLVDNSISAGASQVDVVVEFSGPDSWVSISDNGSGMTSQGLMEAFRLGTRRSYSASDLGRFGLGLKTASLSQSRRVTVLSRHSPQQRRVSIACLDLDQVAASDRWEVMQPGRSGALERSEAILESGPGTVVLLEGLDRVLPERNPDGAWARKRLEGLAVKTADYLGMVFHRFIEGAIPGCELKLTVNGTKVRSWNPFADSEPETQALPVRRFEVEVGESVGEVIFTPFVLPPRSKFSDPKEFDRMSGPRRWNRQQGLYIYRAGRLIQSGGWNGMRSADEHTKLGRAALDFPTALDPLFQTNVAKMRTTVPPQVRTLLEQPVHHLCKAAEAAYRREGRLIESDGESGPRENSAGARIVMDDVMLAIRSSAMTIGEYATLQRILARVAEDSPEMAARLNIT